MDSFEGQESGEGEARPDWARTKVERLEREIARLRGELKRLKSENHQLKSWPVYGESVLTDSDA